MLINIFAMLNHRVLMLDKV